MSAQPSRRPSSPPSQSLRRRPRRASASSRRSSRDPHQATAIEVSVRLGVNVLLGIIAVSTLIKLVPYNLSQQQRLGEVRSEVAKLDQRVDELRAEFDRHFDPQQSMHVMQEQSARVNPNQRQIIWVTPSTTTAQQPDQPKSEKPQPEKSIDGNQWQAFWLKR
jgi:cell division protein FtsL